MDATLSCPNDCWTVTYSTGPDSDADLSEALVGDVPDGDIGARDFLNHLGAPTQVVRSDGCPSCGATPEVDWGVDP